MPSLSLKIVQDDGAVTRKVKLDSRMTVKEAHKVIKDKVILPNKKQEYALFLRSADDDMSGVWLEDSRTLDYYLLRDGDSLDYICRMRNLRVKLLDDTVKTMPVDEAKTVGELMFDICARIGIKNHDEYGLCKEEEEESEDVKDAKDHPSGTGFTLKRPKPAKERDLVLEQMSKKLKTDDNVKWLDQHRTIREQGVDVKETLLLKRRLFYSDRNVDSRDPVQLHLLYVQTKDAILEGHHMTTEQQGTDCKIRWINIRDVHRRILKKNITDPIHPPRHYKYDNELEFIKPFYRDVEVLTLDDEEERQKAKNWHNLENDSAVDETNLNAASDDSDEPIIKKPKTKKKKSKNREEPCFEEVNQPLTLPSFNESSNPELDPTDPVDAFLLSIGSTLKTFSPYHLNVAKSKIFAVVQDHDLQQIVEKEKHGHSSDIKVSTTETLYLE